MAHSLLMGFTPETAFKTMDELLEQLVKEAQWQNAQTQEQKLALNNLVDAILRSRKICRPFRGQTLSGVSLEIYQQVRWQLLQDVSQELDQYNLSKTKVRTWVNELQNRAFRKVLNDNFLKKLALEAQKQPPDTALRQHTLGELVQAIQLSGQLCYPHREKFPSQFYNLLYEDAVVETLTYVCQKIDQYDPERGKDKKFITWVNFRLDRVVIECRRKFSNSKVQNLPSLADLEKFTQPLKETPDLSQNLRKCLENDVNNLFEKTYIRNRADANFKAIALARFSGKTWEEISAEFDIPVPTLSSFFQRCCCKFKSNLKKSL